MAYCCEHANYCTHSDHSNTLLANVCEMSLSCSLAEIVHANKVKGKGSFYSAVSSPSDRSKRFTLVALPNRPVHSDTNSAFPGSILAIQQLRATTKSLTFPPLSKARYSFIQLSELGRQWRERKCPIFEMVAKGDSNPGSLECESSILPLSYRAPHSKDVTLQHVHESMSVSPVCISPPSGHLYSSGNAMLESLEFMQSGTPCSHTCLATLFAWASALLLVSHNCELMLACFDR